MTLEEIQNKIQLAREELIKGNYNFSNSIAEEIQNSITICESTDVDIIENYIISLRIQERSYFILGKTELQFSKNKEALELSEKYNIAQQIGNSSNGLGLYYSSIWENEKALQYFEKALHYFEKIGDKIGIGSVFHNIGQIHSDFGENEKAIQFYGKALLLFEENNHKEFQANTLSSIGDVFFSLADYKQVLENNSKALYIYEKIGLKVGISHVLEKIGSVYKLLSDNSKALEYYGKALLINEEIGNKGRIANNLANMGIIFNKQHNPTKALEYYYKALQINQEIGSKDGIAYCLLYIGNNYSERSDFQKGLDYYFKSLHIAQQIGHKNGIAGILLSIGHLYAKKESSYYDVIKAEEYLKKALLQVEEIGEKEIVKEIYDTFHILRQNEKRYKEALEYYKKSIEIEKEIQTENIKNQAILFDQRRKIEEDEKALQLKLARFQEQEKILYNILPVKIADRILNQETFIADYFQSASVLFFDIVNFTMLSSITPPNQLVYLLDAIFQKADEVVEQYGLEKIKTIGDGYLAVANITTPLEEHQKATALAALKLLEIMKDFSFNIPSDLGDTYWIKDMNELEIRIGIHCGEVVAGIIGKNKYTYDLWGDAVNVSSRMESNSEPGRIHISEEFAHCIESDPEFNLIPRGTISIKGKGSMNTFWLEKRK